MTCLYEFYIKMKTSLPINVKEIEKDNYHLFIRVKIGRKKANLLLDTGASKTVFDKKKVLQFIEKKYIKKNENKSVGLGTDAVKTATTQLAKVKFNKLKLAIIEVVVLDLSHVNITYKLLGLDQIDGVLGSDFLYDHKAIINYEKKRLTLKG